MAPPASSWTKHLVFSGAAVTSALVAYYTSSEVLSLAALLLPLVCLAWLRNSLKMSAPDSVCAVAVTAAASPVALSTTEWRDFPLVKTTRVSTNTAIYEFALPSPTHVLGIAVGQHISVRATVEDKVTQRSYTPITSPDERGHFKLLIKSYEKGILSALFARLEPGTCISCRGPRGTFQYEPNTLKTIGMVAGGTGLTPMYQVLRAVLDNPDDKTHVSLVFANVTEDDILLRSTLDDLVAQHPDRFNLHYVLGNPPAQWTGSVGYVTKEVLVAHLAPPSIDTKVLLCGPPPMVKAMVETLEQMGYDKARTISKPTDQVFKL